MPVDAGVLMPVWNLFDGICAEPPLSKGDCHSSEHHDHPHEAVLAPMVVLAAGALIRQLLLITRAPIPYTAALLMLGGLLGLLLRWLHVYPLEEYNRRVANGDCNPDVYVWNDIFQRSLSTLGDVDPHVLLHIFLPPLIFESAFAIEWHIFDDLKVPTPTPWGPALHAAPMPPRPLAVGHATFGRAWGDRVDVRPR